MLKEISDSEEVIEFTGDYTGGLGSYGASHERTSNEDRTRTEKKLPSPASEKISNSDTTKRGEKEIADYRYKKKSKIGNGIITVAFGLLLLLVMPTILGNSSIIQSALAQTEVTSPTPSDDTFQAQGSDEVRLPSQEGFSVSLLAMNFSAPHNILYGPDGALWITERFAKNVTRVDPNSGSKLNSMPVPNIHQSEGQDGLMGMAFDPDFNNTHYIYVAYTYDADIGEELDRHTKITRFTYDPAASTISKRSISSAGSPVAPTITPAA